MTLLEAKHIDFAYRTGNTTTPVLKDVSFQISKGEFVGIQGRSGSGKSTLFHILGCLLKPTSGTITFNGTELTQLTSDETSFFRNREIGFVFQQFFLLPRATVLENILLPVHYPLETKKELGPAREKAIQLAKKVGLSHRLDHLPNQLSGGEQQRVAIARALMNDCSLLLADEPTGNLDSKNTDNILELLHSLNREGKTIVLITHDPEIADQCPTLYQMHDGVMTLTRRHEGNASTHLTQSVSQKSSPKSPFFSLLKSSLPLAFENLSRNRMRAFLTMIGVSVGIAAVYAMLSFGEFAKDKVIHGYEELGANTVMLRGFPNWEKKATDYTPLEFMGFDWKKDILPLSRIFPQIDAVSPLQNKWGASANYNGRSIPDEVMVLGINDSMMRMVNRPVILGRNLSPFHIENADPVCLIGTEIKERLFQQANPIGSILFMSADKKTYPCKVIGVAAPVTSNQEWRHPNKEIYVPFTYFSKISNEWESKIHTILVQFRSGTDAERLSQAIKFYFEQKYGKAGKFMGDSDLLLLQQMKKAIFLFTLLLVSIALITLTVGGIGINNMMLVSIAERFREIGLRKALGATDKSIRLQFLLESTTLSFIAGIAGVIFGFCTYQAVIFGASKMVSKIQFEWVFPIYPLILSVVSIFFVGILSGIVPALKAEKLEVIEALRNE